MTRRNWTVFAAMLIAASALVLAGCGGDDGVDQGMHDMVVADLAAAQEATMAAETRADDAETAAMAAADRADDAETAAMAAADRADDAETAAMAAADRADDAETAAMAAEDRADDAELAEMLAQENIDDLQAELDELNAEYDPRDPGGTLDGVRGRAAAARIAASAAPTLVRPAIGDNPGTNIDESSPPIFESRLNEDTDIAGLTQSRLGQPPMLSLSVAGGPGLNSPAHLAADSAPTIPGWVGVALERDGPGAITQAAWVYSDAEYSIRAFGDVYPYNRRVVENMTDMTILTSSQTGTVTYRFVGDLMSTTESLTAFNGRIPGTVSFIHELETTSPSDAATGNDVRTLGNTTASIGGNDPRNPNMIRGFYDGVPGEFTCTDGNCVFTLDRMGVLWVNGTNAPTTGDVTTVNLLFRADDPDAILPDQDYLAFGTWTEVPYSPTLANPGRVRAFTDASAEMFTRAEIEALQGSASYSGPATGHYATRAQAGHEATYGRFTATATIMANFDGSFSAPSDQLMRLTPDMDDPETAMEPDPRDIRGHTGGLDFAGSRIDSFVDQDDNGIDTSGWIVNLLGANVAAAGTVYGVTTGHTGDRSWDGVWDATFHGTNHATYPTGIVGRFKAVGGTPQPVSTPEGRINQFLDEGFAGVVGSFAGR